MQVKSYPVDYPLDERFPDRRELAGFEGGKLYVSEKNGKYFIITDEGTLADFLLPEDDNLLSSLVRIYEFESEAERERYIQDRGWVK
jgi:hypothetical protein